MRGLPLVALLSLVPASAVLESSAPSDCACAMQLPPSQQPSMSDINGDGVPAHDPAMAKQGRSYYLFCTGPGISTRTSKDLQHWSAPARVFPAALPWSGTLIPRSRDYYWAPDVSYFNHKWHLYYAVSTFGSNRSAIGLATNATLDTSRSDYGWVDEGPAVQSQRTDDYNAIDPNITFDEHNRPWVVFGSFWTGIKILRIDPATGKPVGPDAPPIGLAQRPSPDAIEAPFIIRRRGYFYLFVSFDFCCRGVNSTYNIRVGRSRQITGPYEDKDGKAMLDGGGSLVLDTRGRWHGPGGCSVLRVGRRDYLVYHAYDAEHYGAPKLRIEQISWDAGGWPTVPSASASAG